MSKVMIGVRVTARLRAVLENIAEHRGLTVADAVTEALSTYINDYCKSGGVVDEKAVAQRTQELQEQQDKRYNKQRAKAR